MTHLGKKEITLLITCLAEHYGTKLTPARLRTFGIGLTNAIPYGDWKNYYQIITQKHFSGFLPSTGQILMYLGVSAEAEITLNATDFLYKLLKKVSYHGIYSQKDFEENSTTREQEAVRYLGGYETVCRSSYSSGSFQHSKAISIIKDLLVRNEDEIRKIKMLETDKRLNDAIKGALNE